MRSTTLLLLAILCSAPGCMLVDLAVDPVGCQTGSHKPIFPWYPSHLLFPPQPKPPASNLPVPPAIVTYGPPVINQPVVQPTTSPTP